MSISVVINTKNAAKTLEQALQTVAWADEIIVMDMHSSDDTIKIAQKFKAKTFSHPDVGYVEPARNAAIAKAKSDWVLVLDADEEVPPELAEKVKTLISGDATAEAYFLPRKNIVFNHWYQHAGWWPDYQLRLFKKGAVTWSDEIHQPPKIHTSSDFLAATEEFALLHHNYQTVEQFVDRLNRYTSHEVSARQNEPVTGEGVVVGFANELATRLFKYRGIDGGLHGVGLSFLQAYYELVVQLKLWQKDSFPTREHEQKSTINGLRYLQQVLNYWIADWQIEHTSGLQNLIWRLRRRFKV